MSYRLIITLLPSKGYYPITIKVGIPGELAKLIQNQPIRASTFIIEESPGYISKIPLLDFKKG